jgi:hypothetical protein
MTPVKEIMRRVDRASLGFEDDEEWVGTNLSEVYNCIDDLYRKVQGRDADYQYECQSV